MTKPLTIIIVEKRGSLKSLSINDFKMEELYKKCGFKKGEDFCTACAAISAGAALRACSASPLGTLEVQ